MANNRNRNILIGSALLLGAASLLFFTRKKSGSLRLVSRIPSQYPVEVVIEKSGKNVYFNQNFAQDGEISLPEGTYDLKIQKQGFFSVFQQVKVETGKVTVFQFTLQASSSTCNQPNAVRCNGKDVEKCVNNQWTVQQTCPQTCSGGVCVGGGGPVCTPRSRKNIQYCADGKTIKSYEECNQLGTGFSTVTNQCPPPQQCTLNGQEFCRSNNILEKCINGQLVAIASCQYCANPGQNQCVNNVLYQCDQKNELKSLLQSCSSSSQCTGTQRRCDPQNPNVLQQCQNGSYVGIQSCARGCSNGACN